MSRWWGLIGLGVAAFAAVGADLSGCSSQAPPDATGGSAGSVSGAGGQALGMGGASVGGRGAGGTSIGGSGAGGTGVGGSMDTGTSPGSCVPNHVNPDTAPGGACTAECGSVSCGIPCTEDCCVTCGIDAIGTKTCVCPAPGLPYANCSCAPPPGFPTALSGGACSPQGYATTVLPTTAPDGSISLKGMPCRAVNLVCFTAESTAASQRGCICAADGVMHCGSVNHWFVQVSGTTEWMP